MLEERHYVGCKIRDATLESPFSSNVEGDGLEVAREGRNLLEESPPPEAQASYEDQGLPLAVDVVVYAGVLGDRQGHAPHTSSRCMPSPTRNSRGPNRKTNPQTQRPRLRAAESHVAAPPEYEPTYPSA